MVRRRGRQHDQIDSIAHRDRRCASAARAACTPRSEVVSPFSGDVPLADAGALDDPLVGRVDHLRQVVIAQDPARAGSCPQPSTTDRHHRHDAAPAARRRGRRCDAGAASCRDRPILASKIVAHHVVAEIDRCGEALGVGAAVALDDDAVEAEEDPAVGLARIHLVAQRAERRAGPEHSPAWPPGPAQRLLEKMEDLARGALGSLERDIAGEALGDHHIDRPLADVVALDEAEISNRPSPLAQHAAGLA